MLDNQVIINRNLITLIKDINKERAAGEKMRILALPEFDINTADALNDYKAETEAEETEAET
jgi:hypothetical protein